MELVVVDMNYGTYKAMLTATGRSARDRAIYDLRRDITRLAADNPSYKSVIINGEHRSVCIDSTQNNHIHTIKSLPNESLRVGNHVFYNNKDYYITSCSTDDEIYCIGEMELCNYVVRFISPYDGSLVEYPTLLTNTTKFNTGETPNKRLTLVSGQFSMILPVNEHTLRVDNDFRFLLDRRLDYPSAYRVTYVDPFTYGFDDGLLNIILLQCDFNPDTDNKDLMVADYYKKSEPVDETLSIRLEDSSPFVRVGGSSKTFTPVLTGRIATPLVFTVKMLDEIIPFISYETSNTSITFTVKNDMRVIGNYIDLTISDSNGKNSYNTLIKVKGLI